MRNLFLFFIFIASGINAHPLHFSITNVDINENSINVSIKFFTDDFTNHLNSISGTKNNAYFYFTDSAISIIKPYISKTLVLKYADSIPEYEFSSSTHDEISIWVNFKIHTSKAYKYIFIDNRLFLDCFMDQTNLLILSYNEIQKGLQFDAIHCSDTVQL